MSQSERHEDEMDPVADSRLGQASDRSGRDGIEPTPLPSIIVDPSLTGASGQEPVAEGGNARLSVDEAERFATSFRPTWEPTAPEAPLQAPRSADVPAGAPSHPLQAPVREAQEAADLDLHSIAGANRRRTAILGGGVVLAFVALFGLAWFTTHTGAPSAESTAEPATEQQAIETAEESSPATASQTPSALAPEAAERPPAEVAEPVPTLEPPPQPETHAAEPEAVEAVEVVAPVAPAVEPTAAGAASAAEPAVQPEAEAVAPEPSPVAVARLRASAAPPDAKLMLDGAVIPNPFEAELPRGQRHVLQASARGYEPQSIALTLTRNRVVAFRLERERAARPAAPPKKRAVRSEAGPAKGAGFVDESPY